MATESVEKRWEELKKLLKDTRHKVDVNVDIKKYYDELKSLQDLLGTYEKWLIATETPAEETADISKQLEQSKVMQYAKTSFFLYGQTSGSWVPL